MQLRTELLFPTPLWIFEDCDLDNDLIVDFIYEVQKEDPKGMSKSNIGGWQSNNFVVPFIDKTPFKDLHKQIQLNTYAAADEFGFNDYTVRLSNLWANINKYGDSNAVHTHSGSMFAGVYYAKIPNCCCGELQFHRPYADQCLKESWGCDENFDRHEHQHNYVNWYVQPKPGTMVIFPSWLMHSVDRSASEDDRISLSFNMHVFSDYYREDEVYPQKRYNRSNVPLSLK
tara:strand:+ start:931 stop:1617 length:687 start_codon:yes stop_codon:yes gene_type:complete